MIPTMEKSFREKIALAVFLALIVLSSIGLGWYILAGHSWNVAASTIDDTVGEMEGYTAIVYPGTLEVPEEPSEARKGADRLGVSQDDGDEAVDLGALQEDYADKGAEVLFIDVLNPSKYQEGVIVKRGGKRIGVVSAAGSATQLDVARCLQAFEQASVDFTVVITPDKWKVSRLVGRRARVAQQRRLREGGLRLVGDLRRCVRNRSRTTPARLGISYEKSAPHDAGRFRIRVQAAAVARYGRRGDSTRCPGPSWPRRA